MVCPVHEASWPGNRTSCLAKLTFRYVVDKLLLPNELLSDELVLVG